VTRLRATLTAALLSILAPVTAAEAGLFGSCESRPGTPTHLNAKFTGDGIDLSFINTAHDGMIWWDVEVRDGAGNLLNMTSPGSWGQPGKRNGSVGITGAFRMPPLLPNTTYCFKVRARDQAGRNGCVSQIWTGPVCVTTPDPERAKFCTKYADDARDQAGTLQDRRLTGACAVAGARWLASWPEHFDWCMRMRGDPSLAHFPDVERNGRNETLNSCRGTFKTTRSPRPTTPPPPPPPPPPEVCAVNALLTVEQCYNVDGTPAEYYPGATQELGCGTSEDEAVTAAKASLGIALSDDPAPNHCTFSKQIFAGICACSPMRNARTFTRPPFRVPQQACAGELKPNAAGRCACPAGTAQNGFRCVASAGGPGSIQPSTPGATPAADKPCFANMVSEANGRCACPPGTQWSGRQCLPFGGTTTQTPPPPSVFPCPRGTSGTYPNCRVITVSPPPCLPGSPGCGGGGADRIKQSGPSEQRICPEGTRPLTRGGRVVRCGPIQGQQPQTCPDGTRAIMRGNRLVRCDRIQDQQTQRTCPAGTRPLTRNGRIIRCMSMQCPRHTTGTWPNCQTGGATGTKPGESSTTTSPPRVCAPGWSGRYPRCRPPRSESQTGGASGTKPGDSSTSTQQTRQCRPGTFGRWPRCRKIGGGGTTTGPTPKPTGPKVCPAGLTGPNCDRIIVR
jgi:hypothetical protein